MAKKREKEGEREPKVRLSMRGQEERREGGSFQFCYWSRTSHF